MKIENQLSTDRFRNDQGAALISMLLIGTLLMVVGGSLAISTTVSGQAMMESTGETQAYYAAEAGIQRALDVLRRGNAGDPVAFSDVIGDSGFPALITDTNNDLISETPNSSTSYTVSARTVGQNGNVRTILITSTGTGPRGETKVLEVAVSRDESPAAGEGGELAAFMIANTPGNANADISVGNSNAFEITGMDRQQNGDPGYDASLTLDLPAFGVIGQDVNAVQNSFGNRSDQVTGSPSSVGAMGTAVNIPSWLENANATRSYIQNTLRPRAGTRIYNTANGESPTGFGTPSNPKVTFIDGSISINPSLMSGDGGTGSGLLVVTGDLTLNGNINFNGIIMLLGNGRLIRHGGGGGTINGGIVIAKFGTSGDFLQPVTETSGGGNSTIQRNSAWQRTALGLLEPPRTLQIRGISEQ
jgi:hypothetical protein